MKLLMNTRLLTVILSAIIYCCAAFALGVHAAEEEKSPVDMFPGADIQPYNLFPQVKLETNRGDIVLELNRKRAPITVNNFLSYAAAGDYDNTIFHRLISKFVIQGGGYKQDWEEIPSRGLLLNESGNGLNNTYLTVAMARFNDPHTASSQFFINLSDNRALDPNPNRWGYAVFGEVIKGEEVLLELGGAETGLHKKRNMRDVPTTEIVLKKATLLPQP